MEGTHTAWPVEEATTVEGTTTTVEEAATTVEATTAEAGVTVPGTDEPEIDVETLPSHVSPPDHWQELSACYGLDPEVFFPTTEEEAGLALSYCGVCQVREMCLAWAVRNGERYGVWGGTTEQQRRRLIRQVA